MLAQTTVEKPLKQGWVLKKAGSGFLAQWKQKYIVLVPQREGLELCVYDQRDTSLPPKHRIKLSEARVDTQTKTLGTFKFLKKGATPFTIFANTRKVVALT